MSRGPENMGCAESFFWLFAIGLTIYSFFSWGILSGILVICGVSFTAHFLGFYKRR